MSNSQLPVVQPKRHAALSELLAQVATDKTRDRISIGDLLEITGDRAFGALMFVFALPNVVPTPPGTSLILGLPLVLLAFQLTYGRRTPWLPPVVASRSIARTDFAVLVARAIPMLSRCERVLKPRWGVLISPAAQRLLGLALLTLAVILALPIPFGNMLPAVAICILSLALIEHDGLAASLGILLGVIAVLFVWGAVLILLRAGLAALEHFGWL